MPKRHTAERRLKVKEVIERLGIWNVPISTLAVEYDVTRKVIYKDIDLIVKQLPQDSMDSVFKSIQIGYKRAMSKAMQVMIDPESSTGDKLMACRTIGYLEERFTKMLEAYGKKEKVADRLKIDSESKVFNVNINIEVVKKHDG